MGSRSRRSSHKPLTNRVLQAFYPEQQDDHWVLGRSHGIVSHEIKCLDSFLYEYSIDSPSAGGGQRRYTLPFTREMLTAETNAPAETFFRALIGESVLRIIVLELFRRHAKSLSMTKYGFRKCSIGSPNANYTVAENRTFRAHHTDRYNIEVVRKKHGEPVPDALTEYDGMIEYEYSDGKRGLVICEAKTGIIRPRTSYLVNAGNVDSRQLVGERIINPLKSLFPDHQIDYLFMAHSPVVLKNDSGRGIKNSMVTLMQLLNNHDIGLILFPFNEPISVFDGIAHRIATLRADMLAGGQELAKLEAAMKQDEGVYFGDGWLRVLTKGRRVEAIYEERPGGVLVPIYRNDEWMKRSRFPDQHNHHPL